MILQHISTMILRVSSSQAFRLALDHNAKDIDMQFGSAHAEREC